MQFCLVDISAGQQPGYPSASCNQPSGSCQPDGSGSPPPVSVSTYPIPIVPSPGACPCYLVSPNGTEATTPTPTQPQLPPNLPPNAIIGYIPVIFFPYCPGNSTSESEIQPMFPSALAVPYQCSQCNPSSPARSLLRSDITQSLISPANLKSLFYRLPRESGHHEKSQPVEFGRRITRRRVKKVKQDGTT